MGHSRRLPTALLAVLLFAGLSCDGDDGGTAPSPVPASLEAGAVPATAAAGDEVAVSVRVLAADGAPVSGVDVSWTVTAGDGSVAPARVATDGDGRAEAQWTLGPAVGSQAIEAAVVDLSPVAIEIDAQAGSPAEVDVPDEPIEFELDDGASVAAAVRDAHGNAIDTLVAWSSRDTLVARVSEEGRIAAQGGGATHVLARVGAAADSVEVRVAGPALAACPAVSIEPASARPLDSVLVTGVPEGFGDVLSGLITVRDDPASGHSPIRSTEDAHVLVAPLHPIGGMDGGTLRLRITDFDRSCAPVEFEVLPLEPAPGTLEAMTDDAVGLVALLAELFGTTPEALAAAAPDTLLPPLLAAQAAQTILDHPDNPNSLRAILAGTAPILEGGEAELALIEALLAGSGADASLADYVAELEALGLGTVLAPDAGARREVGGDGIGGGEPLDDGLAMEAPTAPDHMGSGMAAYFYHPTASELDKYMSLAVSADLATSGKPAETWDRFTTTLAVGAAIPHPLTRSGYGAAGGLAYAYKVLALASAHLLPSRFIDERTDFVLDPAFFEEDRPGPGAWDSATVTASSKGWTLDEVVLESLLELSGTKGLGGLNDWFKRIDPSDPLSEFLDGLRDVALNEVMEKIIAEATGGADILRIPEEEFGPTDVTDDAWSDRFLLDGASAPISMLDRHRYEPVDVGTAEILVVTEPGEFGYQQTELTKTVEVGQILVDVEPDETGVTPGDTVELSVTVSNALDPAVEWEVQPDVGALEGIVQNLDGTSRATYVTPTDPAVYPIRVTARSTADTGLRDPGLSPPERSATARIVVGSVTVSPGGVCVEQGGSQQFSATVTGASSDAVTWEASVGQMDENGLFAAPSQHEGAVTITARSVEDPDLTGSAVVHVSQQCACWWAASIQRGAVVHATGDVTAITRQDGGFQGALLGWTYDGSTPQTSLGLPSDPIPVGQLAADRPAGVSGFEPPMPGGDGGGWGSVNDEATGTPQTYLTLERNDARHVRGRVSGRIFTIIQTPEGPQSIEGFLRLWFYGDDALPGSTDFCSANR